MSAAPRDREARAIALLVDAHLNYEGEWSDEHWATAEAAARVVAEWVKRDGRADASRSPETVQASPRKPRQVKLPRESPKRRAERVLRDQVRAERLRLNPVCEGVERGIAHNCGPAGERIHLEVHEIAARSVAPGSQLVVGLTATVCPRLHDGIEDGSLESVNPYMGGLVLPSNAVSFARDESLNRRLPQLRPEWQWARP